MGEQSACGEGDRCCLVDEGKEGGKYSEADRWCCCGLVDEAKGIRAVEHGVGLGSGFVEEERSGLMT